MSARKPGPIPLCMLLCDSVLEDKKTGKKSLIGMFNGIASAKIPCTHATLCVFVALTEGNGEYQATLRCVRADNEEMLLESRGIIRFPGPQIVLDVNYEIASLKLPSYGAYRFDFYCNEDLVISRRFQLTPAEKS